MVDVATSRTAEEAERRYLRATLLERTQAKRRGVRNRLRLDAERDKQVYAVRIDGRAGKQASALRDQEAVE